MADRASPASSAGTSLPCPPGCVDARLTSRLLTAAADVTLMLDYDGVIRDVAVGDAMQSAALWSKLVGRRWAETVMPDSQAKVEQLVQQTRAGLLTRPREINQQAEGEGSIPFRFSAVLHEGEQRLLMLGRDLRPMSVLQQQMLSAQQAMDREYGRLRQAETRYRLLFQLSSEGAVVADATTLKVLEVNPAASALLEESAQVLQARTLEELFAPASWPAVQALLAAVDAGGRAPETQARLRGHEPPVTTTASVFRQSGAVLLLVRFRTSDGAQQPGSGRSARMLAALEALPDGFVVTGEDWRILSANPAFCELVQQAHENQVVGQSLERWLGRPGVDLTIMLANLREHGSVRNFATIIRGDYGAPQEAVVSAVAALAGKVPCLGFSIRPVSARLVPAVGLPMHRSVDQLRELVGRVSLKEILRESTELIEKLCIEAALKVSRDNRASAAQLLGLSRQGLYSKLRRYGLGDLESVG